MATKILVVDDEKMIVKGIKFSLEQDDMAVDTAFDGEEALNMVHEHTYDAIVLDVMLPKMNGMEVCQHLRAEGNDTPIIMLTARGEDMDKILGLEYGADDYMVKPFNILELKARLKAILRRVRQPVSSTSVLEYKALRVDFDSRRVFVDGKETNLTAKEFDLLERLAKNQSTVYSREKLLDLVWGYDYPGDVRTVDVHVRRLREKIERNPGDPEYIQTKWGVGYYFKG